MNEKQKVAKDGVAIATPTYYKSATPTYKIYMFV